MTMENVDNFEYYILDRDGSKPYPLLICKPECPSTNYYMYQNLGKKIEKIDEPARFEYGPPILISPVIGDYFSQPKSIVSKKIKNILDSLDIESIQLIPAEIETNKGDIIEDFYYVHIFKWIKAVDRNRSEFRERRTGGLSLEYFKLDEDFLKTIDLKNRLVFLLEEDKSLKVYHKTIVDKIMEVNPTGLRFIKIEDWRP